MPTEKRHCFARTYDRRYRSVEDALDYENLVSLLDTALAPETMDINRVNLIRNYMERVEARRLQPHYIQSFFLEAFKEFGGGIRRREHRQYEVSLVPRQIRSQSRQIPGAQVQPQYERIVFEKESNPPQGQLPAEFICPGHPLLDATLDLALERYRDLMRRGAVLVDEARFWHCPADGTLHRAYDSGWPTDQVRQAARCLEAHVICRDGC